MDDLPQVTDSTSSIPYELQAKLDTMDEQRQEFFESEDRLYFSIIERMQGAAYQTRSRFAQRLMDRLPDERFTCLDDIAAALAEEDVAEFAKERGISVSDDFLEYWLEEDEQRLLYEYFGISEGDRAEIALLDKQAILEDPESYLVIWICKGADPCSECLPNDNRVFSIDDKGLHYPPHYGCRCLLLCQQEYSDYINGVGRFKREEDHITFEGILDGLQFILDLVGLIPGVGEIADGLNAVIYVARGDYVNAGLSLVSMIPVAGWLSTGAKFIGKAIKIVKVAEVVPDTVKLTEKVISKAEKAADSVVQPSLVKRIDHSLSRVDDIIDAVPPAGKLVKATPVREVWKQSELKILKKYHRFTPQKSFMDGVEVKFGTKGSVRPDGYKRGFSLEVKRYDLSKPNNVSNLINTVANQANQRILHLPKGTIQIVAIDITKQSVDSLLIKYIKDSIYNKSRVN